ncbi:hypothetical protein DL240_17615 [Lujinxingia litoralis]|uniref:Signal transduction histidine kinase dimerisation/phosphoacceptor domain-containing protein n=1 Tax=Lujinxingia litoralis TaxID=2211119 RepID=A0A328C1B4_9DELT|nr:HAMP domain-containing histidine kinase [Lujinxingia litoralis]RAL20398.1 hypothetical protein DL240_17615 [Lujinxingia litoralis]
MRQPHLATLPRSSEAFEAFFEWAPWPMHLVDASGRPGLCNPALVQLLGLKSESPKAEELFTPESARSLEKATGVPTSEQRDFIDCQLTYLHASGVPLKATRLRLVQLPESEDEPRRFVAMLSELSPPQPLTRAALQSRLAGAIAHDFNNVFTVAASYVDLVRHQVEDEQQEQHLERALKACRRGIALVDNLQLLTSLEGLPATETELTELIEGQKRTLNQALAPGPRVHLDLEEDLPVLRAHPSRVGQLVVDLVANALLRWPQASRLEISARRARAEHPGVELRICGPDDPNAAYEGPFWPMLLGSVEHQGRVCRVPDVIGEFFVDVTTDQHAIVAFLPTPALH